jgi:hypothetical protein
MKIGRISLHPTTSAAMSSDLPFEYRGCSFICSAVQEPSGLYRGHVLYRSGLLGVEQTALPVDTDPYASAAEALRHAEQQAVRWTNDRTGDGKGRF